MGIGSDFIDVLGQLRVNGFVPLGSSVIEIGAQQLENSFLRSREELRKLGLLFGIDRPLELPEARPTQVIHGVLPHLDAAAPSARLFWEWLGLHHRSVDIDGTPGSIPLDLNFDSAPAGECGKYQIVTNHGTTEHVANQLNAFKIIHDLTAPGGVMVHRLPAQGMFNHGLVNYNFKFFWMLARSNDYEILHSDYYQALESYTLPENIVDFVGRNNAAARARTEQYRAADAAIAVVIHKRLDIPFVPPLDVPTGVSTDHEMLRERYWTVFAPERLAQLNHRLVERRTAVEEGRLARLERARRAPRRATARVDRAPGSA